MMPKFSIVVPFFNEEENVPPLLAEIRVVCDASDNPMRQSSSTTGARTPRGTRLDEAANGWPKAKPFHRVSTPTIPTWPHHSREPRRRRTWTGKRPRSHWLLSTLSVHLPFTARIHRTRYLPTGRSGKYTVYSDGSATSSCLAKSPPAPDVHAVGSGRGYFPKKSALCITEWRSPGRL